MMRNKAMRRVVRYGLPAALIVLMLLGSLPLAVGVVEAAPAYTALPDGFYEERIVAGLRLPTSFAVARDGRVFITEKSGRVRVVEDGVLLTEPFIDLSTEVNDTADRGLMGVAVHPRFPAQPYVYLAYTYDPPEVRRVYAETGARVARVLRVEVDPINPNVHKAGSGVVVLGTNSIFENIGNPEQGDTEPFTCYDENGMHVRDCLATEGTAHTIDFMRFARDGSLFVSMGDGVVNSKGNWRAQDPNSLNGKILRIDPMTGNGYANNPFYDGDLTANRAKVWAMGLRNPFRFTFHPTTGALWVGEVGNNTWEELNVGTAGANFGWPCFEGQERMTDWAICDPLFNGSAPVTHGIHIYPHESTPPRGAIIGGDFYSGRVYPAAYRDDYFFSDFNGGVIWNMSFARDGSYEITDFATSVPGPVQISMGPDGYLWMLYIATGELVRLGYASGVATSTPVATTTRTASTSTSQSTSPLATGTPAPDSTPVSSKASEEEAAPAASTTTGSGSGEISREVWTGISGAAIADLLDAEGFPDAPDERETLRSLDAPRMGDADYGQRIRGYLYPPRTGQYRFWIAADDSARLVLSSDETPENGAVIASAPTWTPLHVWDKFADQASGLIRLEAGKRYYIEILHKQADQKDNLSVAWQTPGGTREIISGEFLSPVE